MPTASKPSSRLLARLSVATLALLAMSLSVAHWARVPASPKALLADATSSSSSSIPGIVACDINKDLFKPDEDDPEAKKWTSDFTDNMGAMMGESTELSCSQGGVAMAGAYTQMIALALPQWSKLKDPPSPPSTPPQLSDTRELLRPIFSTDIPSIMVDYFEAYNCALQGSKIHTLYMDLLYKGAKDVKNGDIPAFPAYSDIDATARQWKIDREQEIVKLRETMERVLMLHMGIERLQPVDRAVTCINQASKDLRNVLGILAEGSECLPVRTWDTKAMLRKFPKFPQ